ncbi:unnamed protein product [Linum trigynum]|uniref:C2H2-type domain-containing protein n=1 Tax=Linum trigynum TaxID=586398 RepID=A0AAV2FRG7_9ROSI
MTPRKKKAPSNLLRRKRGDTSFTIESSRNPTNSFTDMNVDNTRVNKRLRSLPFILSGEISKSTKAHNSEFVPPDPYTEMGDNEASCSSATNDRQCQKAKKASVDVPTARKPLHNDRLNVGKPDCVCQFCGAFFWYAERLDRHRKSLNPVYSLCCQKGRVCIPLLKPPPPLLAQLLDLNGGAMSKHFRDNIRPYNGSLCFTYFGAKLDPRSLTTRGPYSMVICGENYHRIGSLLPVDGNRPKFAQLYIFEPENEVNNRLANFASREEVLLPELLASLLRMLDENNELVRTFRRIRQDLQLSSTPNLRLRIFGIKSRIDNMTCQLALILQP